MKVRIATQVTIDASPASVFKYLTHLDCHYLWNPQLRSISAMTPLKLGSIYASESVVLGVQIQANNEVTAYTKNQEIELLNNTGTLQYRINFRLQPQGKKTLLRSTTVVSTNNKAFAFAKPVLKMLGQRELQSDLQALKIAVEQKLT